MKSPQVHRGRCLCGAISYEIEGEVGPIMFCQCSLCRKVKNPAFLASAPVSNQAFRLVSGEDSLKEYEASPGVFRLFCGECASPLLARNSPISRD